MIIDIVIILALHRINKQIRIKNWSVGRFDYN